MNTYLKDLRLPICQSCDRYESESRCCLEARARGKTPAKIGYIFHAKGIGNPCTSCPIGRFDFIVGEQVKYLLMKFPFLPRNTCKVLNRQNLAQVDSFKYAISLYPIVKQHLPDMKLSTVKNYIDKAGRVSGWTEPYLTFQEFVNTLQKV